MKKDLNALSDHDLLVYAAEETRKQTLYTMIACIAAVFMACLLIAVLFIYQRPLSKSLDNINQTMADVQETLPLIEDTFGNVNSVVVENTEAINTSVQKISAINIDSLNDSIEKLGKILTPISNLFGN